MPLTTQEWHNRYSQQAEWTRGLRNYLYTRVELGQGHRVLDVGCGTGILVAEMEERIQGDIFGLDLSLRNLSLAIGYAKHANFLQGDAHFLPYSNQIFDLSYCHFLLLWVTNPLKVVKEMARVTRPGGVVLALAEPDYGSRIDFPEPLPTLGQWQATSLEYQGADPRLGRRLSALFHQAGLVGVQTGVLGGE